MHTEPKLIWTRCAAYMALFHGFYYTLTTPVDPNVLWFDGFIIGCWALGGNGRAALVDAVRAWKING